MTIKTETIKPYVIGLDLGGTNSVFGIVDKDGNIIETVSMKTGGFEKADDYVDAAVKSLMTIVEKVGLENISSMGIGAPNGNYYSGSISFAYNLNFS
mgnify:CR=1 FL=1